MKGPLMSRGGPEESAVTAPVVAPRWRVLPEPMPIGVGLAVARRRLPTSSADGV